MPRPKVILLDQQSAYLPGTKCAITTTNKNLIADPPKKPVQLTLDNGNTYRIVPWGQSDNLPQKIMDSCYKSPIVTAGMGFNCSCTYGDGIIYGRWNIAKNGKKTFVEDRSIKEINDFLFNNDINNYLLEQANDISWFYNVFPEILLNKNGKIVGLNHKEAAFSRLEEMDPKTGLVNNHFYSAKWGDSPSKNEIDVTPILSPFNTVDDLRVRMGISPDKNGRKAKAKHYL